MGQLDELLEAGIERGAAPGAAMTVVNADGVLWEGGAGERVIGSGAAMTPDTVGAIFSMTKALTGTAAMLLVEQGRLDLDAPAGDVIPFLGEVEVLDGFDGDTPVTRPPSAPVTLRNLLTHTSGFVYDIWNPDMGKWYEVTGTPSLFSLENAALRTPLAFDPGSSWEYGIGIDWVGKMIEAVSGQTLGEYLAEHVLGPMGMNSTGFMPTDDMLARFAGMHARMPDGSLAAIDLPPAENPEFEMGGGGLAGSMPDYARFIRMMLGSGSVDGAQILSPDTVSAMGANHIGPLRVTELKTSNPQFSNDAEFFPGEPKSWGLTFQRNESAVSTGQPEGTLMWAGLANSFFWIDPANGIGGCYMSQILPFADTASLGLYDELVTAAYQAFIN